MRQYETEKLVFDEQFFQKSFFAMLINNLII